MNCYNYEKFKNNSIYFALGFVTSSLITSVYKSYCPFRQFPSIDMNILNYDVHLHTTDDDNKSVNPDEKNDEQENDESNNESAKSIFEK